MDCLRTDDLSYRFGDQPVLDGVGLRVPAGSIYGFLGPNGAGKTTTLRLILGLLKLQSGTIEVFGRRLEQHRIAVLRRVGSLIESPSLYEHLSAKENLVLLQKIHRCPAQRVGEVLALVGLEGTGSKRAGTFSLGMKQRLSIAIALLHEPDLLILDEPTNGLDPAGIVEMRDLLRRLNRERGTTLLISSHLLGEIDRLVSHVGILHRGRLRFQGTIGELKAMQQAVLGIALRTGNDGRALQILAEAGVPARIDDGRLRLPVLDEARIAALNRQLVAHDVDVHEIAFLRNDLERIFLGLIGERA